MPASKKTQRRYTLTRIVGSGFAGAALVVAAFASSTAAATSDGDFTRADPDRSETIYFDPFRTFTNCLAAAAHPDSVYPGVDPDEVNSCLEANGVL
ncbi:hypothetical protein [Phytoactinopolyspora endophytica]|uniref:hypothetical protein n=1 Tax=Phytoactinopolyspora endophytica TaxID=1642495 RepID=UPI00101D9418|nr:hypothetical protein [Phytoactinopolyspora endophytica]